MAWRHEDGGPRRTAVVPGGLAIGPGDRLTTTSRVAPAFTMVVGDGDRLYVLRHTAGEGAVALVERIDPRTLEPLATSVELAAGQVRADEEGYEVLVLDPVSLDVVARATLPEPSIARLSADGDDVYVVGDASLVEVVTP